MRTKMPIQIPCKIVSFEVYKQYSIVEWADRIVVYSTDEISDQNLTGEIFTARRSQDEKEVEAKFESFKNLVDHLHFVPTIFNS